MTRLWDRNEPLDRLVLEFTAGEDHALDDRLVAYDVRASAAHAEMLRAAGHLSDAENGAVQRALAEIGAAHARGEWRVALEEEDCHTALENRLTAAVGEAGARIHLGRSRNDQVLAALRLWLKDELAALAGEAEGVAGALDAIAARQGALAMPGYTHMQRAMPTSLAGWTGAFAAEIRDDAAGLLAARRRADRNPLGSAAGYGVPVLSLDRALTTRALGFAAAHEPVTAVQLSRGKAEAGALFEAALLAQDLGRLAADLCLFATAEFGFVKLPAALTTGSSMLPQKRNPDLFELVRGRTGEATAALLELLAVTAKLPSGYHRDLQLTKKPLFRGLDSASAGARLLAHALPLVEFDEARMRAAVDPSLLAAERAYRMVVELGLPFREAYRRARET
ncbi:MAG: argininosuccinate lyase [Thermoanaerobaculaceae bacterium]|nr:argininosuccinate lyase [Thermoanaerobaculaceae bacterium]TAM46433.1 MAG: argininosuccinate lyase [Acidobacteriota bacterium]